MGGECVFIQSSAKESDSDAGVSRTSSLESSVLDSIQTLARELRKQNGLQAESIDFTIPVGWEERIGHLDDEPVRRLIVFLRSTGCEWVEKTGGCTMCGFYCATAHGKEVSEEEYVAQFKYVMDAVDLGEYPIVSIYNDGNIFNERETPLRAIERICDLIDGYKNIRKVVVESRIDYSPEERVKRVKECLNGRLLELAFGFESADPQVMNLCINKGFSSNNFDAFFTRVNRAGVLAKPLLLVKPPFLTESESIEDLLKTIGYLAGKGIRYIDLEVMTVERNTVVHELWKRNLYRPPWLWSLVELLKRCRETYGDRVNLYVSPWTYSVESLDWARNCGHCDAEVIRCIEKYNAYFDTAVFDDLDCSCRRDEWRRAMDVLDGRTIPERIRDQLEQIRT